MAYPPGVSDHRVLPVIAPQTALNVGNRLRSWLASAGISAPRADELEGVGHFPQVEAPTKVERGAGVVAVVVDELLVGERLNTEVVELYYMHRRDLNVPVEETVGAMVESTRWSNWYALARCAI